MQFNKLANAADLNMLGDSITAIHDIKETTKRTHQFTAIAVVCASILVLSDLVIGNYLSASLVAGLDVALLFLLWINKRVNPSVARTSIVFLLNIFFVAIAMVEGLNSGCYLYFLPLLFSIPFFLENTSRYLEELVIYVSATMICFGYTILGVSKQSMGQLISESVQEEMFITNAFCSFLLCATFAYLSIYLERRYATALLEQKNKTEDAMLARSRFLSSMGHELRTPLNGIIGAANLLGKDLSPVDQKEYLGIVKYCSDHMLRLVNDILDFNKIEADQLDIHPVECNIKRLLHQSALPFYNRFEEKKLELKVTVDESIDEVVMVDDVRLVQVLNNLISNAWKFTETGSVNVVAKLQKREDNIATISFSVIDTGIGITKENQQKIFESFWQVFDQATRKYGGTGLGLTISKRLLILMNSHLEVESEGGKGSKFSFTLSVPVVSGKKQTTLNTELVSSDLNGMRILVVEDNIINMIIAKKILEDANALISKAENGQEALDVLQDDSSYDIILLDLEMPVMDGYTAIKEMKKFYPHIPVIAFTAALIDNEMWDKLITLGFSDCLLKPFQPLDLFAKVKKHTRPAAQQV